MSSRRREVDAGLRRSECEALIAEVRQCLADGEPAQAEEVLCGGLESFGLEPRAPGVARGSGIREEMSRRASNGPNPVRAAPATGSRKRAGRVGGAKPSGGPGTAGCREAGARRHRGRELLRAWPREGAAADAAATVRSGDRSAFEPALAVPRQSPPGKGFDRRAGRP